MSSEANNSEDANASEETSLFGEFTFPTYEAWYEAAVDSLKGASFEKLISHTYEGIALQPLYRQEETADLSHPHTHPGFPPYVRGRRPLGYVTRPWLVAQELAYGSPQAFNEALRFDMARGQTAVNLLLDLPTRAGLDPDQAASGEVGHAGVSLATAADAATALEEIDLAQTPLFVRVGTIGLPFAALLIAHMRQEEQPVAELRGGIEQDPLGVLARRGTIPHSLVQAYDEMAQLTIWAAAHAPHLHTIAVHTYPYPNSGGHAVQELALAMATGVAYLRAMQERGIDIDTTAGHMLFAFSIGGDFFMEVAKLRAARILWAQIVAAFGGSEAAQQMTIHARTAFWNKTVYDPYVNMLRATTEAFAGALGGSDSLHVAPFDEPVRPPDDFSRRIARNVQLILQQECHMTRVVDPAGGSWYVEFLTDQLGRKAWSLFQEVERQGGQFAALQAGFPQEQVAQTAVQRAANLATRKDKLVGTNVYPHLDEERLPAQAPDTQALTRERTRQLARYRREHDASEALDKLAKASEDVVETAVAAALAGATINQITAALRGEAQEVTVTPVQWHRVAEPFEALRRAAEAYEERTGARPPIFLASVGPLSQHRARVDFAASFFEVGGFELLAGDPFDTPQEAAAAALASGVAAVVVCASDDAYPQLVPLLAGKIKAESPQTMVILAGYPAAQIETYKAAGVDEFIHRRADCYQVNLQLQKRLGVQT